MIEKALMFKILIILHKHFVFPIQVSLNHWINASIAFLLKSRQRINSKYNTKLIFTHILMCLCIAHMMCQQANSKDIPREKLQIILKSDLKGCVEGIDQEQIADSIYYDIIDYRYYEKGTYGYLAIVEFNIFKKVNVVIRRKYRYHVNEGLWERFSNKYHFKHDSTNLEN